MHVTEEVEFSLHWAILRWHPVGHVDFRLFVSCVLVLDCQRKCGFWPNQFSFLVTFDKRRVGVLKGEGRIISFHVLSLSYAK